MIVGSKPQDVRVSSDGISVMISYQIRNQTTCRRYQRLQALLENDRIETVEIIVKIVDAELVEHREYASMGKSPVERLRTLLSKLDLVRRSKQRGSEISNDAKSLSHKFVGQVKKICNTLVL